MVRVLQVSANVSPLHGGPPELALNLNLALREHGHDACILTSDALLSADELRRLRGLSPEHALRICRSRNRLAEKWEWFRALRHALRERPVVHIHGYYLWQTAAVALLCRRYRVPYLVHCHGIFEPYQVRRSRPKKAVFDALAGRRILGGAAGLIFDAPSEQQTAVLPGRFPGLRSFLIPPCPPRDREQEETYPVDHRMKPVVLFLARIAPKKRVDLVIKAMPAILSVHPSARLRVAGLDAEGLAAKAIRMLPPHCREAVSLEGFVTGETKAALLNESAVYVLPSENENFGISVAEALAAGIPVVISPNIPFAPEVEQFGAGAVLCELSAAAVADAVCDILNDSKRYFGMQCAARALGARLYSARTSINLAQEAYTSAGRLSGG